MSTDDSTELDASALASAHAQGALAACATLEDTLASLDALDPLLESVAVRLDQLARTTAERLDGARQHEFPAGPLCGVPVMLKSNLCLAGVETNCGSRALAGYRPPYTATVVERLLAAGAVPVAMGHMDEFAMGSSGENSAFARTRNPWDLARTPGGSSSGPAAAVAAGLVPLALGSDTGGSVRQPAALCGITGFKPTYGRLSRFGLVAFGSSLDQVGILARSVRDVELALEALSGADGRDATSLDEPPVVRLDAVRLAGLRVGVPAEAFGPGLDPRVRAACEAALERLEELGCVRVPLSLPSTALAIACYYVVATAEAASNLARYDGVRYGPRVAGDGTLAGMQAATRTAGFGPEVVRRILLGTYVLSRDYQAAWYGRATGVRAALAAEFRAAFERVDVLAGPTTPTPAFRLGEKSADPLAMYLSDALTVPASLAGLPAISVPAGFAREGQRELPVGLQLTGPHRGDAHLLAVARAFQEATEHHLRRPALAEQV
ncbi:MAG TPA: Asp-tRNA(Asn)/Glu-tRNA(Gln) amidotransferase subunit GatA [Planctomycetota bacterium]